MVTERANYTFYETINIESEWYKMRGAEIEKRLMKRCLKEFTLRPLKNAQFCSSSRQAKILTTGIHRVF